MGRLGCLVLGFALPISSAAAVDYYGEQGWSRVLDVDFCNSTWWEISGYSLNDKAASVAWSRADGKVRGHPERTQKPRCSVTVRAGLWSLGVTRYPPARCACLECDRPAGAGESITVTIDLLTATEDTLVGLNFRRNAIDAAGAAGARGEGLFYDLRLGARDVSLVSKHSAAPFVERELGSARLAPGSWEANGTPPRAVFAPAIVAGMLLVSAGATAMAVVARTSSWEQLAY